MARFRYAFRNLKNAPLLSTVVILSLGLGIGVNTAIFSLLHQVVLSALPVPHPERLVLLKYNGDFKTGSTSDDDSGGQDYIFNWRMFREFEKHTEAAQVAGFRRIQANVAFERQTVPGSMLLVSGKYFSVMGVRPYTGRLIEPSDDVSGAGNPVAVLDYRYWHDRLGSEPVLNRSITVNGQQLTIVGVAPPGFAGTTVGREPSVFAPISLNRTTPGLLPNDRLDWYWVYLVARLNSGVSIQQAQAALSGPFHAIAEEVMQMKEFRKDWIPRFRQTQLTMEPGSQGHSEFRDAYARAIKILMGATLLVLLIAMANAANLLLARSAERRKELAVRAAIGAGRGELMAQLLTEAMLLSAIGCAVGIAIASVSVRVLASWMTDQRDSFAGAGVNWPVLLFSIGLSLAVGVLVGFYPAWDASRTAVAAVLSEGSGKASGSRTARRMRVALVCAQVTLSVILLVPTGLFVRSLTNLLHVNLGIRTDNVIGFYTVPRLNGNSWEKTAAEFAEAEEKLAAIPGVRSVATSLVPLIAGDNWGTGFALQGSAKRLNSKFSEVGPNFFGKMGIPLIAGREILDTDTAAAPKVVVVNEEFAKQFCGGRNPIGLGVQFDRNGPFDAQIVGVVRNSHYSGVRQKIIPVFYRPWRQDTKPSQLSFYLKTAMPPEQIVPQIRATMAQIDRDVPLQDMRTLTGQVHENVRNDEIALRLAGAFAVLATLLAMLGLYGVMAYGVARRTREIGIRMALGAAPGRIRSLIMSELVWILGIGLGLGIPAALAGAKITASQLFGVKPNDTVVVVAAACLLSITAAAAAFLPAQRAAKTNPLEALRHD